MLREKGDTKIDLGSTEKLFGEHQWKNSGSREKRVKFQREPWARDPPYGVSIPVNTHRQGRDTTPKNYHHELCPAKSVYMYRITLEMVTWIYRKYTGLKPVMNPSKLWQATTSNVDRPQFTYIPFITNNPIGIIVTFWDHIYTHVIHSRNVQDYRPHNIIRDTRQDQKAVHTYI